MTNEDAITNLEIIRLAYIEPVTKLQRKIIDDTFDMAIKALEQTRWIPVSERLPEIGQDVLCTIEVDCGTRIAVCKCKQEVWWYYAIAWMPLPEPYKEVEK